MNISAWWDAMANTIRDALLWCITGRPRPGVNKTLRQRMSKLFLLSNIFLLFFKVLFVEWTPRSVPLDASTESSTNGWMGRFFVCFANEWEIKNAVNHRWNEVYQSINGVKCYLLFSDIVVAEMPFQLFFSRIRTQGIGMSYKTDSLSSMNPIKSFAIRNLMSQFLPPPIE